MGRAEKWRVLFGVLLSGVFVLLFAGPAVVSASGEELRYDDACSMTVSPWADEAGSEIAVRFTPSTYPVVIQSATFYIPSYGEELTEFGVRVYDGDSGIVPGTRLDSGDIRAAATQGGQWVDVDLSAENIVIYEGDFFVSMVWLTPSGNYGSDAQCICIDKNDPVEERTYWKWGSNGSWQMMPSSNGGYGDAAFCCTVEPYSAPVPVAASFSVSCPDDTAPAVVSLIPEASGSYSNWTWDFGDGQTETLAGEAIAETTHTYAAAGTYTIQLTVSGPGGTKSVTEALKLFPYDAPAISPQSQYAQIASFTPSFSWGPVQGAHHYVFEYGARADFSGAARVDNLQTTEYTFSTPLDREGAWYWRVFAVDSDGNAGKAASAGFYYAPEAPVDEIYNFELLWPTSRQNQFFNSPVAVAAGAGQYVYVADTINHRVQKLTADGYLITTWGIEGSAPGSFNRPSGIAVDSVGSVYVADGLNYRIQKFDENGAALAQWGSRGSGPGQFEWLADESQIGLVGMATDPADNLYVADIGNQRIQKFSPEGDFLGEIDCLSGSGGTQLCLAAPSDVSLHPDGRILVLDRQNGVLVCSGDGETLLSSWGDMRPGVNMSGTMWSPVSLAVDKEGDVYLADEGKNHVMKFADDGQFLYEIGWDAGAGACPGVFRLPFGVAVDENGFFYVADRGNNRIQKFFAADGGFSTAWGNYGREPGELLWPGGLAIGPSGDVYAADIYNHRVQRFTESGEYVGHIGGLSCGVLCLPSDIAIDAAGTLHVADTYGHRVTLLDPDLNYRDTWGVQGSGEGEFLYPVGVVVDGSGYVYVADAGNSRIQKFAPDGTFVAQWGSRGSGEGQFLWSELSGVEPFEVYWEVDFVVGMAVDAFDHIYVVDRGNHRVQKFRPDGTFVESFGTRGSGPGQFEYPSGVFVDENGNLFVTETGNHRVQEFSYAGDFRSQWGQVGIQPGQMSAPIDVVAAGGRVYVSDSGGNNRIQRFKKSVPSNGKAIIVAGGGPFKGNNLWPSTQMCANLAYKALSYRGYTKENIFYMTADDTVDLDGNGELDDVSADATNANLGHAITEWGAGSQNLVLYITDHGGDGFFRMGESEILSVQELAGWLDTLEETMPGRSIVVYDACESGSFVAALSQTAAGPERVVITSTAQTEQAHFVGQGAVSFSQPFWSNVLVGKSLGEAYAVGRNSIETYQTPFLDANGNGVVNESEDLSLIQDLAIGQSFAAALETPMIIEGSAPQQISDANAADLYAVLDGDTEISRVWAVIRPPNYMVVDPERAVQEFPTVALLPEADAPNRYRGTYEEFYFPGTYHVAIYAVSRQGYSSLPHVTTVSIDNPLQRRKAIIVAGDSAEQVLDSAIEKDSRLAYEALRAQQYTDDDILFLSSQTIAGVDMTPSLANIEYAVNQWAAAGTYDLVLYLVGSGFDFGFDIREGETLTATQLDLWLDGLQGGLPGDVTVVCDACRSQRYLSSLTPASGQQRILIASAGAEQVACFAAEGDVSFSSFFWRRIARGDTVRQAFFSAKDSVEFTSRQQTPGLDDNGNGVFNEKVDGALAGNYTIGMGIITGSGDPAIGSAVPDMDIGSRTEAAVWAEDVITTGILDRVWAVVLPPGASSGESSFANACGLNLPTFSLAEVSAGRYEATYSGFTQIGEHEVRIYAMDVNGNLSRPARVGVTRSAALQKGDINWDDAVNEKDVEAVLRVLSNLDASDFAGGMDADTNADGKIGLEDVFFILQDQSGVR